MTFLTPAQPYGQPTESTAVWPNVFPKLNKLNLMGAVWTWQFGFEDYITIAVGGPG
jgi:hypothetical protein